MESWSNTEIYPSWQIATGLAIYGAVLRRNVGFCLGMADYIWPNMPTLLVGPSGEGKDTIIRPAVKIIENASEWAGVDVNVIPGRTIEAIKTAMCNIAEDPTCGVIVAGELSALLGQKDYQQGIVTDLTDILSAGDYVDISLKADVMKDKAEKSKKERKGKRIPHPTITMFAGSTRDWLLTMLPEGSLEGGFLPRFVIVPEESKKDAGIKPIANPNRMPGPRRERIAAVRKEFETHVTMTAAFYAESFAAQNTEREHRKNIDPDDPKNKLPGPVEFHELEGEDGDAAAWYENWYANRHGIFGANLHAYANRSALLIRKLAMLMAITRGHKNWIEVSDYQFADQFIRWAGSKLEGSVIPQAREVVAGRRILGMLPATEAKILNEYAGKFGPRMVKAGLMNLVEMQKVVNINGVFHAIPESISPPVESGTTERLNEQNI